MCDCACSDWGRFEVVTCAGAGRERIGGGKRLHAECVREGRTNDRESEQIHTAVCCEVVQVMVVIENPQLNLLDRFNDWDFLFNAETTFTFSVVYVLYSVVLH